MPYIQAKDFRKGLDRSRERVSGEPGTLWDIQNAHITRGGDVERAKRFAPTYTVPPNTYGLTQVNGQLYVHGSDDVSALMPVGVQYQRLLPGNGAAMVRLLDAHSYDGKLFAGAEYDDGNIAWFYDGTRVAALDTLADANSSFNTLANYIADKLNTRTDVTANSYGQTVVVTSNVAGTGFTISGTTTDKGGDSSQALALTTLQANVVASAEVLGTGTITIGNTTRIPGVNQIAQVTLGGVALLNAAIDYPGNPDNMAAAVALAINDAGKTTYKASSVDNVVTLVAPSGSGASVNGTSLSVTVNGTMPVTANGVTGGVAAIAAQQQVVQITLSGAYEPLDLYSLNVNGTAYAATGRASGHMTYAFIYKKRIYGVAGSLLRYCAIGAPTDWSTVTPASGSSFINLNSDSEGSERLVSVEQYQTYVAIFSRRRTTLYALNTDATTNTFVQTLQNTGTVAPRSVVAYGNTDVFYLDETGIRSIKARDASNAAFVSDVGTAIDTFVRAQLNTLAANVVQRAIGLVEPIDGRFWLSVGSRIYVLSYYPSKKIEAWSYYDLGANIDGMVRAFNRVYVRQGTKISLYGGYDNQQYPLANEQTVTVKLPFLNGEDPATMKKDYGFDIACTNEWLVYALPDPSDETKRTIVGRPNATSYVGPGADQAVASESNVVAFDFTCTAAGRATLSAFSYIYGKGSAA